MTDLAENVENKFDGWNYQKEIDRLKAENAALKADAERYRFLKELSTDDESSAELHIWVSDDYGWQWPEKPEKVDEVIDLAMCARGE